MDEWPHLYPGLVIAKNPGIGLGPWNIKKRRIGANEHSVTADDCLVVFYHYHSLRMLRPRIGLKPVLMAEGSYEFESEIVTTFYRPYALALWYASQELDRRDFSIAQRLPIEPYNYKNIVNPQLLLVTAGHPLSISHSRKIFEALYPTLMLRRLCWKFWSTMRVCNARS